MMPLVQFEKHKEVGFFVGVHINHQTREARLMGWCRREVLGSITSRKIKENGPLTLAMRFSALRDMRALYRMLDWKDGTCGRGHDRLTRAPIDA